MITQKVTVAEMMDATKVWFDVEVRNPARSVAKKLCFPVTDMKDELDWIMEGYEEAWANPSSIPDEMTRLLFLDIQAGMARVERLVGRGASGRGQADRSENLT